MTYVIVAIVLLICCAVAEHHSKMEKEAEEQKEASQRLVHAAQLQNQLQLEEAQRQSEISQATRLEELSRAAEAKRPEAFKNLFCEEFPGYTTDITYGKSEQILLIYTQMWNSDRIQDALSRGDGNVNVVLQDSDIQLWFVKRIAPIVSSEFVEYAESFPEEYMYGLTRSITSTSTIVGQ